MRKKCSFLFVLFFVFSVVADAEEFLIKKIPIYAVVKPAAISTLVSIGNGIVQNIVYQVGDDSKRGQTLIEILERDGIRPYRNTLGGKIAKIHVTNSASVTVGMPLITIIDPTQKKMEVSLSPDEANKIAIGDKVTVRNGQEKVAEVWKISPLVDPDKGSVTGYLKITGKVMARIGEILEFDIWAKEKSKCEKVVDVSDLGLYTKEWRVDFISGTKVCLQK